MEEVSIDKLLKIAKSRIESRSGEIFASKLANQQCTISQLEEIAQKIYEEYAEEAFSDPSINYPDLVIFTSLLMSFVYGNENLPTNSVDQCLNTLEKTVLGFAKIDKQTKNRVSKYLFASAQKIRFT